MLRPMHARIAQLTAFTCGLGANDVVAPAGSPTTSCGHRTIVRWLHRPPTWLRTVSVGASVALARRMRLQTEPVAHPDDERRDVTEQLPVFAWSVSRTRFQRKRPPHGRVEPA